MFAREVLSLHTAHLPVPKTLTSKSRVSITSKLIQTKGLQALYFGHLRKTGGRGSYQFATILHLTDVEESLLPTPLFPLHTKIPLVSPFFPLLTQKQGSIPPRKCRRADIPDFSPYISHFSCPQRTRRACPERGSRRSLSQLGHGLARRSFSEGGTTCYLKGSPISV